MALVGREAWVRQQERAKAMNIARSIPSTITSRLLSLASQMTAILQQLELPNASVEEDCRILGGLVVALNGDEDHYSKDVTEALAVAMLLRAWSADSFPNEVNNEEVGLWNSWKAHPCRGLAALEKLGWEHWIPVLLPWLPHWHALAAILLPNATAPHLSRFLITSLAYHAEHALLSHHPHDAIPAMKGLDTYLLQSSAAQYGSEALAAFSPLQHVLDSWLAQHLKLGSGPEESLLFQAVCQLRTRLALCFSTNTISSRISEDPNFPVDVVAVLGSEVESIDDECDNTLINSKIEIEEKHKIWQHILFLNAPGTSKNWRTTTPTTTTTTKKDGTRTSPLSRMSQTAVGLAAHAAVSALFLQDNTTLDNTTPFIHTRTTTALRKMPSPIKSSQFKGLGRSTIFSDPDPASPARVTLALLNMLEDAAMASEETTRPEISTDKEEEKKKKTFLDNHHHNLEILPFLIWTVSGLVLSLEQKQELLIIFLLELDSEFMVDYKASRALLEQPGTDSTASCTALFSFHQWAQKESIALSNLVHIEEDKNSLEVIGEEGPEMDAAVHAVFPAALLCPGVFLKTMLDGAAGQRGQAMLLTGILHQLPMLTLVKKTGSSTPILLDLLRNQLGASSTALLDEDQRNALQHCIVTLGSPPPHTLKTFPSAFGKVNGIRSTSTCTAVPAISPEAILEHAVLPALCHAAASPVESAQSLSMLFKLSRLLLDKPFLSNKSLESATRLLNTGVHSQLSSIAFKFLEFSSRRIDLNPFGLLLPREVIEEAYAVAQRCTELNTIHPSTPTSAPSPSWCFKLAKPPNKGAGGSGRRLIWELNDVLCTSLAAYLAPTDSKVPHRELFTTVSEVLNQIEPSQIKDALVVACAVMLPCCAAEEALKLYSWIKEAVSYTLSKTVDSNSLQSILARFPAQEGKVEEENLADSGAILDGVVIEVLCRAVHALAFVPGLAPIAGEDLPITNAPSQLRCRAVGRFMQHLSLASQAVVEKVASPTSPTATSIRGALAVRIFKEISRCAASVSKYYDVSTLHVCLMQLIHVLKQEMAKNKLILSTEMKDAIATGAEMVNDPGLSAAVAAVVDP